MKKFLVRLERALIRVALNKSLRPVEHQVALALAKNVLVRVGAGSAATALVVELVNKVVH